MNKVSKVITICIVGLVLSIVSRNRGVEPDAPSTLANVGSPTLDRRKRFLLVVNQPVLTDAEWETSLRDLPITAVLSQKELSIRVVLQNVTSGLQVHSFCKVVKNVGGEEWPREILTYQFDRVFGFYLTPPAVPRLIDFRELEISTEHKQHVNKLIGYAKQVRKKRMASQPLIGPGPTAVVMIAWLNNLQLEIKDMDQMNIDSVHNIDTKRHMIEFRMLQYLTSCQKIERGYFYANDMWWMIDNDRCFRERRFPLSPLPRELLHFCQYPKAIINTLRGYQHNITDVLYSNVEGVRTPAQPTNYNNKRAVSELLDWVHARMKTGKTGALFGNTKERVDVLLAHVTECLEEKSEREVFY